MITLKAGTAVAAAAAAVTSSAVAVMVTAATTNRCDMDNACLDHEKIAHNAQQNAQKRSVKLSVWCVRTKGAGGDVDQAD
ncbi:hypothetical protein MTOK_53700 [Mycolicibacterium tokaiense]|nr:hypothetical protein MTOK_53700 [Mycolicibacterium tokaiense]